MHSLGLAGALLILAVPTAPAMAQQVVPVTQDVERNLRDAHAIVERLGRPGSAATGVDGPAREETGQSWTQHRGSTSNSATLPSGSIAAGSGISGVGSGAPASATNHIGTIGSNLSGSGATVAARPRKPSKPIITKPPVPTRSASTGGGKITANAENITSIATGGTAVTDIGVSEGSGRSSTDAKNVVTLGAGEESTTRIGGCQGTVSAENIFTYGGATEICPGSIKRNGMTCIEIYRDTCIIHAYIRPKNSPCAPLYWTEFRRCRLPSDYKHAIRN
jgi:hypothetical protein